MNTHLPPRPLALACACALVATSGLAAADPPRAPPAPNQAMLAAGVVLAAVGGVGATLGAVRFSVSELCPGTCSSPARNEAIGGALIGAGTAVLAGGIVLIVLANRRAPAVAPGALRAMPAWAGQPGGAGWRWRF